MADDVAVTPGSGAGIATDEIAGVKVPSVLYSQDEDGTWWYRPGHGRTCRTRAKVKTCKYCGDRYLVSVYKASRSKYCSRQCAGAGVGRCAAGPGGLRWKGGRIRRPDGYIHVYAPEHPSRQGIYVAEHRLVMERELGRFLKPAETVHHINGVRDDNRLENLELWSSAHPGGVRVDETPHCATCTCSDHRSADGH